MFLVELVFGTIVFCSLAGVSAKEPFGGRFFSGTRVGWSVFAAVIAGFGGEAFAFVVAVLSFLYSSK